MQRDDYKYRFSKTKISYFTLTNNKVIHFVSNYLGHLYIRWKVKVDSYNSSGFSKIINDFNSSMERVDLADQLSSS